MEEIKEFIEESLEVIKKRDKFLLDIINQFIQSDEKHTIFDYYDYVKIITETTIECFTNILTVEERILFEINTKT